MNRSRVALMGAFALATAAACGGNDEPPAAPVNVRATPGDGVVSLQWDPVAGATAYDVYFSGTSGVTKASGAAIHATETSLLHQDLTNGIPYFYVVTASNAGGESAESAEVSATPIPAYQPLAVTRSGTGGGTVSSDPAAIDCGATCSSSVATGTTVTLTATPDETSTFQGWSGACEGTGPCTVALDAPRSVAATFVRITHALAVTRGGTGGGVVASDPAGIDCGITCEAAYEAATVVTLTATPDGTSTFWGWTGACTGSEPTCQVTIDQATSVTATFTRITYTLTIATAGGSGGTVTSEPAGIDCGSACSEPFDSGTIVTLTAAPNPGSTFAGWSGGGCSGTGTCSVTIDVATTVGATFTYELSVAKAGTGGGTVASTPSGISCGTTCSAQFEGGTFVTLTATPDATSTFEGWSGGGCTGTSGCTVPMDAVWNVTATFARITYALAVSRAGSGGGAVTSSPAGIDCGATCSASFDATTLVTLTPAPDSTSSFAGWSGNCSGTGTCSVTMSSARSVTATFTRNSYDLTVAKTGDGAGTVTSDVGGISCGATCSGTLTGLTVVTLTAAPNGISAFDGWSGGGCSGTGTCAVTMDAAKTVSASFRRTKYWLGLTKTGTGQGFVYVPPFTCATTCASMGGYRDAGTVLTITATPDATSTFTGWGGACAGTEACSITIDADKTITAGFVRNTYPLVVSRTAGGTVTSTPAGIDCGASCSTTFVAGTVVTLTATPDATSSFAGWSGACTGTGTCTITISAATSVTATFRFPLSVSKSGTGGGNVTSTPAGISCGATCTAAYGPGTTVSLVASPDSTSSFAGWGGGACTGTGTCEVSMDSAKTVTATFLRNTYPLSVTRTGAGTGTVASNPAGIDCGSTCSATYDAGTTVVLTASVGTSSVFTGWSGSGCSGTGTCTVTMDAARAVTASFGKASFTLALAKAGTGAGTVTSSPAGVNCDEACVNASTSWVVGFAVVLTATADATSTFAGWAGCDSTTGNTCNVSMDRAKSVTATFTRITYPLTVTVAGPGGTVASTPAGIDCGFGRSSCSATYAAGTVVTLDRTVTGPAAGFVAWGGACAPAGTSPTCTFTMSSPISVTAAFY